MPRYAILSHAYRIVYFCLKYRMFTHRAKPRHAQPRNVIPRHYSCLWCHIITGTPSYLFLFEIMYADQPRQTTLCSTMLLIMPRYTTPSHAHHIIYSYLKYHTLTRHTIPRYTKPRYTQPRYYSYHVMSHHHTHTVLFIFVWNTVRWTTAPQNIIPNHVMSNKVIDYSLFLTITLTLPILYQITYSSIYLVRLVSCTIPMILLYIPIIPYLTRTQFTSINTSFYICPLP